MIVGYDGGTKSIELAFDDEEKSRIEQKLTAKKETGKIRGWSSFELSDMQWCPGLVSMEEALSHQDETAYNATKDIVDLDAVIAFYGEW